MCKPVFLGICCLFLANVGCNLIKKDTFAIIPAADNPYQIQPNSVGVEIFTFRILPDQNELLQKLWNEIDEQSIDPQVRCELLSQGFRAGVVGTLIPPALAQLLQNPNKIPVTFSDNASYSEVPVADLTKEQTVVRQYRNVLPEMKVLLSPFDTPLSEYALFWKEHNVLTGQVFTNVSGVLSLQTAVAKNGAAVLMITPELEYGVMQQKYTMRSGVMLCETSRPRRKFERLTIVQTLMPNQWMIIGATSTDCIGAGKAFFLRDNPLQQRLIAVRLVKTH